jgi:hypothetical protein
MWKQYNNSIDYNTRFCTQNQDDNNKLSLQIMYSLHHLLGTSINRVMKRNVQELLKMHNYQISDSFKMCCQVINNIVDGQDPELWMTTRQSWILKNRQDKSLFLNEEPVQVNSIYHECDQDSLG